MLRCSWARHWTPKLLLLSSDHRLAWQPQPSVHEWWGFKCCRGESLFYHWIKSHCKSKCSKVEVYMRPKCEFTSGGDSKVPSPPIEWSLCFKCSSSLLYFCDHWYFSKVSEFQIFCPWNDCFIVLQMNMMHWAHSLDSWGGKVSIHTAVRTQGGFPPASAVQRKWSKSSDSISETLLPHQTQTKSWMQLIKSSLFFCFEQFEHDKSVWWSKSGH